jgi:nitrite reductase/ring-hydroxylating ferredoxin subunit
MMQDGWWAAALSESVSARKPFAVTCAGTQLVLFRNADGAPLALEDRCPHRRVPLVLGTVKPDGSLQCGYHGWSFDGASGACKLIPNLRPDERIPQRYGARPYRVEEGAGFVHVWLGEGKPGARLRGLEYQPSGRQFTGSAILNIGYGQYQAVMLDGTECLLGFDCVRITDFFLGDARREADCLVFDRGAVWKTQMLAPAFITDHPLIVRTTLALAGGSIKVELLSAAEAPLVTIFIAASANLRGTTGICWRGFVHDVKVPGAPLRWRIARAAGRAAFQIFGEIDGAAIAALQIAPSRDLARARGARPSGDPGQNQGATR